MKGNLKIELKFESMCGADKYCTRRVIDDKYDVFLLSYLRGCDNLLITTRCDWTTLGVH